jgi:hypothetical protein
LVGWLYGEEIKVAGWNAIGELFQLQVISDRWRITDNVAEGKIFDGNFDCDCAGVRNSGTQYKNGGSRGQYSLDTHNEISSHPSPSESVVRVYGLYGEPQTL